MKVLFGVAGLAIVALLAGALPAGAAAILDVQSNVLMGATNVDVNGVIYDVQFRDGTCAGVFSGCDAVSDFAFATQAGATAAAQALLDQVFLGDFDSLVKFTNGCSSTSNCFAFVPYTLGTGRAQGPTAFNSSTEAQDVVGTFDVDAVSFNTSQIANNTWAVFSHPPQVPEPATLLLLGSGLAGLAGIAWRAHRRA